jgi:transposase
LEIDNNSSERTLRPCAIGRKNWLFFGSDRGGETAAILMSILASAKRHGIEPFVYVCQLLIALSSAGVDLDTVGEFPSTVGWPAVRFCLRSPKNFGH